MTRPKTKRIVWTLAVLLALSFVALMVLLHSPQPQVIGNFSKLEVSKISKNTLEDNRLIIKMNMRIHRKSWQIGPLLGDVADYFLFRVKAIQRGPDGSIIVTLKAPGKTEHALLLLKDAGDVESVIAVKWGDVIPTVPPNTAPVSQRGVGK